MGYPTGKRKGDNQTLSAETDQNSDAEDFIQITATALNRRFWAASSVLVITFQGGIVEKFEDWWKQPTGAYQGRPFPSSGPELEAWCKESFIGGRKIGIAWAEQFTAKQCIHRIQMIAARYPVDVFPDDGRSVDAQSAKMARHVCDHIIADIEREFKVKRS